jgi:hypothetical protein
MITDNQLSSSSYHVLTPRGNALHSNLNHPMIDRLMSILNDHLDDAQQYKDSFSQNSMQPIIFDVLRGIKQRNGKQLVMYKDRNPEVCFGTCL